ncbi:hypothetical protein SHKM778_58560 [Streptomyces sp. KM77-8]|uniref:Plastocyanin-like domain-containing protein n=1 Tax=Streptomyces haneummycinicus TaxID=3074435 RepID=A0AAT9HPT5_9ACTN
MIRFRVLNGANAHVFTLGFADEREFHVVASDAGLLDRPVAVRRLRISPGERFEIVVAFDPGEEVLLKSFAGDAEIEEGTYDLLRLVAAPRLTPSPGLPARLTSLVPPPPANGPAPSVSTAPTSTSTAWT